MAAVLLAEVRVEVVGRDSGIIRWLNVEEIRLFSMTMEGVGSIMKLNHVEGVASMSLWLLSLVKVSDWNYSLQYAWVGNLQ